MKRLLIFFMVATLFGCAAPIPQKVDLDIETARQTQKVYPASLAVNIIGQDQRAEPWVIFYQVKKDPAIKIASRVPPQLLVRDSLYHGLHQQGVSRGDGSGIEMVVVIKDLLAKVSKPGLLYVTKAKTHLQLVVGNNGSTLTLDYNREDTKKTITRPEILDLEMQLNNQLTDIIRKMLVDKRIRTALMDKS